MRDCPRYCQRFSDISISERILNSLFLLTIAIGYLFSLGQVYFTHQGRDGQPGLSIADVAIAYHGSPDQTRLAAAINGPMAGNLKSPADKEIILDWIDSGAQHGIYESQVAPVLQRDCLGCHSPASGVKVPPLTSYEEVVKLTEADRGASIPSLVRVSHIHLFGIAFILFFVGKLFIYCDMPVWLKRLTIGIPFLSMLVDIFAWYLTRETPAFAYLLVVSGALMGLSLNFQIALCLYQMWLPISYYRSFAAMLKNRYADLWEFVLFSEQSIRFRKAVRQKGWEACAYLWEKLVCWLDRELLLRKGGRLIGMCQDGIKRLM
ncbi:MAG: hypothetical protein LUQ11_08485 [Methylococcaceae bacterium]|nr:hypothetical protein [Methylococcaceae bacterium]